MAKQDGIIQLRGTIGNITFGRRQDGSYTAQKKTPVTKERILTDPAYIRTRENMSEFGRALKGVALIKSAARLLLKELKDRSYHGKMIKVVMQVIKSDPTNDRGLRTIQDGDVAKLKGFEFNKNASMQDTLYKPLTTSVNRVTGELQLTVPSFIPKQDIQVPEGSTHFAIVSGGYEIDFADGTSILEEKTSGVLPIDNNVVAPITLKSTITANSTKPLFLLAGIQFYQDVNGTKYALHNGKYNALNIAEASVV